MVDGLTSNAMVDRFAKDALVDRPLHQVYAVMVDRLTHQVCYDG